jgi:hypothetical protein
MHLYQKLIYMRLMFFRTVTPYIEPESQKRFEKIKFSAYLFAISIELMKTLRY